ncbi:RNA-directed DNA polymerase, eukaryota, partial [Tanacetum coccineum]
MWVMIEFDKVATKENAMNHTGVKSWFTVIKEAADDFVSEDRIVWVDIEGVPLNAWSRATFIKIGKKWGEIMELEDNSVTSFGRKRVCVKTKQPTTILESFKIVVKGKVFMIRAKELFTWNPVFSYQKENECNSDEESVIEPVENNDYEEEHADEYESEVNEVPETEFGVNSSTSRNSKEPRPINQSEDPFGIYELLNRENKGVNSNSSSSIPHPPGFTPEILKNHNVTQSDNDESRRNKELDKSVSLNAQVMNSSQDVSEEDKNESTPNPGDNKGGSVLGVMEDVIRIGQAMGYSMEGCINDLAGLGNKTKMEWVKALTFKYKLNFLAIQETKKSKTSHMEVKFMWGNSNYDFVCSDALGNSGGIICVWEATIFKKDNVTISDNFIAIYGTWLPNRVKILFIVVYAPQQPSSKIMLWDYISGLISCWNGEVIVMGDFNEVRTCNERRGSCFNPYSSRRFDDFIKYSGLVDIRLEGYTYTWSHPSASKMSKLDRFLISDGIFNSFPLITATCLDRHLSDHRPIILQEVQLDFGPIPFRIYHSWFNIVGFDSMIQNAWSSFSHHDSNAMVRLKKKFQDLKSIIRGWIKDKRSLVLGAKKDISIELGTIDKDLDSGSVSENILLRRLELKNKLLNINEIEAKENFQKSKVSWAIEGDENTKFFHGIINKRRSHLAVRGIFVDGFWCTDPDKIKKAFLNHFEARFKKPVPYRFKINFQFPKKLIQSQVDDLEREVSREEIKAAVWNCGENKSPGPDGYTFEFLKKYWAVIGPDISEAVDYFFVKGTFPKGCNSSFITLIPKVLDAKLVSEFRPICLIGCVYKIVTKILANRLMEVISELVSDTQSAFVAGRQILDGPFILDELIHWCKRRNKQAMFFKVDFAKAYDSIRWDYLLDVLEAFGFGPVWRSWILGSLNSSKASILVNGSPSNEFTFHCGLKQGDPLAPYLFILVMESLHLSIRRMVDNGLYKGIQLPGAVSISHMFYADDVMFLGEWSDENFKVIVNILKCFFIASGLRINFSKSQLLGVGVSNEVVKLAAASIGCSIMEKKFCYLGVTVGDRM